MLLMVGCNFMVQSVDAESVLLADEDGFSDRSLRPRR